MSVFQVDDSGELVRDRQGFVRIRSLDEIAQGVTVRLRLLLGEIPTATNLGTRWLALMAFSTDETLVAQEVERRALSQPGVVAVDDITVTIDGSNRTASGQYRATVSVTDLRRRILYDGQLDVRL